MARAAARAGADLREEYEVTFDVAFDEQSGLWTVPAADVRFTFLPVTFNTKSCPCLLAQGHSRTIALHTSVEQITHVAPLSSHGKALLLLRWELWRADVFRHGSAVHFVQFSCSHAGFTISCLRFAAPSLSLHVICGLHTSSLCLPQGQKVQSRVLIIADGATSKLATHMGYCTEPPKGVCSRAYVEGGTHNTEFDGRP